MRVGEDEGDRRVHLIMDFHSSNIKLMTDRIALSGFLAELVKVADMTPFGLPIVKGFPWAGSDDWDALSGVCFLKESAIMVHTYPEKHFVFLDVFSCKDFNVDRVEASIVRAFRAKSPTILLLDRGVDMNTGAITPACFSGRSDG